MARPNYALNSYTGAATAGTLAGSGIGAADTTLTVTGTNSTWSPLGTNGGFFLTLDYGTASEEKIFVPSGSWTYSNTSITFSGVTRGFDNTSQVVHTSGGYITPIFTSIEASEANQLVAGLFGNGPTPILNPLIVSGTLTVSGTISVSNNKITNLSAGSTSTDAVNYGQYLTLSGNVGTISGSLSATQNNLATLSGNVGTISGSLGTLTNNVSVISGEITLLSGSISTVSGALTTVSGVAYGALPLTGGTLTGSLIVSGSNLTVSGTIGSTGTIISSTEITGTDFKATGITGATAASRYVGATTSGAPISGTFAVGDFVIDQTGKVWVCTAAGTPGTWGQVGSTVSPATTVTGPDAFGAAAVVGTSALYAREDHDHGLPAAPSPALTVNTTTAASVAVPLNVATTIVTSPSLPTGTYLLFADIQFSFVAAPSVVATLLLQLVAGTATMTIPDGVTYLAQYEPIGTPPSNAITLSKMFAITITVAGTVSLNLTSYNEAGTASPAGNGGIVAVKIA